MTYKDFNARIEGAIKKARAYLLSRYSISEPDLDDVIQNAAIKAIRALKSFKNKSSFDTWFSTICRNELKTLFLKKKREQSNVSLEDDHLNEISLSDSEKTLPYDLETRASIVNQALSKLSKNHQEIIKIALCHSGSSQEVADLLKIPVNSARTRLYYAKKHLKQLIKNHAHESNLELADH